MYYYVLEPGVALKLYIYIYSFKARAPDVALQVQVAAPHLNQATRFAYTPT